MIRRLGRARFATAAPDTAEPAAFREAGMVTAELAVALPALVVVLGFVLAVVAVVAAELRCLDAAAIAARSAARGEAVATTRAVAMAAAPSGASLELDATGPLVRAAITVRLRLPAVGRLLPTYTVREQIVEEREGDAA